MNMTLIEAPSDIGIAGRFLEYLEQFLTDRRRGEKKEDLISGRPWEDEDAKRHYFKLSALQKHLEREGVKDMTRGQITLRLQKLGGSSHFFNIKSKGCNVWWVPSAALHPDPESDVPKIEGDAI